MAKCIITLAVYKDRSAFEALDPIICHYLVEYSDLIRENDFELPLFALESAKSYAFDDYYFEEGWKDVIIRYVNHRELDTSKYLCSVRPCTSSGQPFPLTKTKRFSNNYDIKNKKSS